MEEIVTNAKMEGIVQAINGNDFYLVMLKTDCIFNRFFFFPPHFIIRDHSATCCYVCSMGMYLQNQGDNQF